ncbi:MAG TPA: hypothetical protein VGK67_34055 [Myxococcales bacterium]|jgi:hypothetical protein
MRRNALLLALALACSVLASCLEPADQRQTATTQPSLSDCAKRATATGSTGSACTCAPCDGDDVCTKVGRCGKVVDASAQPAKVMLALDRSGSMKTTPESDQQWGCAVDASGNGYDPAGSCKWNQLKELVAGPGGMLEQGAAQARFGLVVFPAANLGDACGVGRVEVPIPSAPGQSSSAIASTLQSAVPGGGTPSAATLRELTFDSSFGKADASRYVVLVTDGLPNCNASNSACQACTNGGDPTRMCGDVRNCLDDQALVSSVSILNSRGIDTFVVGFGAAMASLEAATVLDAAAVAGGRALEGERRYYQAGSAAELETILSTIGNHLQPCIYELSPRPRDPEQLQILMTDQETAGAELLVRGTDWDFADDRQYDYVEVKGERCEAIQAAESCHYSLEFLALTAP